MSGFLQNSVQSPLAWLVFGLLAALYIGGLARWAAGIIGIAAWLLGTTPVADMLIRPLEAPFHVALPIPVAPQPQWIVVLAAGAHWEADLPPGAWLGEESLYRVAEGVRLQRAMPHAKLLLLGGLEPADPQVHPQTYPTVARMMGADPARLVYLVGAANTAAEAQAVGRIVPRSATLYLVTSASHLMRAEWLFRREGYQPIPAPAQEWATSTRRPAGFGALMPQADNYRKVERVSHEVLGLLKLRLFG